ncbi:SOS response-associated peptidase [Corynebacterium uterequi]|nr:SOS response-associated peptidase [Corynebacterium uterequi]
MCGRFVLFTTGESLLERVEELPGVGEVRAPDATPPPRYNIAPTMPVALVRVGGERAQLDAARWALVPSWKSDASGPPLFNARAETVREKPSFRAAFARRRGVIVMDGYYEWHVGDDGAKQPYFVHLPDGELLWAAALWDTGGGRLSCTMVTTESSDPLRWLHHRMPRLLAPGEVRRWCEGNADDAAALLHPAPAKLRQRVQWRPADAAVGQVRNDYPELIAAP